MKEMDFPCPGEFTGWQVATGGMERTGGEETGIQQWHREESRKPVTERFCQSYDEGKPEARLGRAGEAVAPPGCEAAVRSTAVLTCSLYICSRKQDPGQRTSDFTRLRWFVDGFPPRVSKYSFFPLSEYLDRLLSPKMWKFLCFGCTYMHSNRCFPVFINQWHTTIFPALPLNNILSPGKVVLIEIAELWRKQCPAYALDLWHSYWFVSPKATSPTCYSGAAYRWILFVQAECYTQAEQLNTHGSERKALATMTTPIIFHFENWPESLNWVYFKLQYICWAPQFCNNTMARKMHSTNETEKIRRK